MSGDRNAFINFSTDNQNKSVYIADSTELECGGQGDIEVELENGDTTLISNVTYVKHMTAYLLSVNSMVKKGYTVTFNKNGCQIIDAEPCKLEGEIIAKATNTGGLYVLDTKLTDTVLLVQDPSKHELWHRRLAHLNHASMKALRNISTGIDYPLHAKFDKCISCIKAKQLRKTFKSSKTQLAKDRLDLLHTDLCMLEKPSWSGARYMFVIIDDCTRKVFIYFLQIKDGVTSVLEEFLKMVENECDRKIKAIRSDNGSEYCNQRFESLLEAHGIKHHLTVPYNRTILEKMRAMMIDSGCDDRMWAEAANTAVYLINRSPTKRLQGMTPEEKWSGNKPDLSHLRVFGCQAYAYVPSVKRKKLDHKSKPLIFVGYCELTKGYRLLDPETDKLVVACSVEFIENKSITSTCGMKKPNIDTSLTLDSQPYIESEDDRSLTLAGESEDDSVEESEFEDTTDEQNLEDCSNYEPDSEELSAENMTDESIAEGTVTTAPPSDEEVSRLAPNAVDDRRRSAILIDPPPGPSTETDGPACGASFNESSDGASASAGRGGSKKMRAAFNKERDYVIVYTDGACENNGKPNARAGIGVWFGDNHPLNISRPVIGKATNNTAEIQACIQALNVLREQGEKKVKLITDSQFTISCMTNWIKNWKRNNWKTASGGPVKNKEELQKLDQVLKTFSDVQWCHVASHNGIKGNEEADKLARQGALSYRPT